MYNTKEEFALAMSEQLFVMRIESDLLYGDNEDPVPKEFGNKIVDDPEHMVLIKKRIYDNVMANTRKNLYHEYSYTADTYDNAFAVDAYVDEVYVAHLEALEKLEEDQRQARLIVTYKVRVEVIRIETDPEDREEEHIETDSAEMVGNYETFYEARQAQADMQKNM